MNEKTYRITLADGTVIENLKLNGNNYISETPIVPAVFHGNCSPVVIGDGIINVTHDDMELVQLTESEGSYWFILRDIPAEELEKIKMQSDIEYVAMMAGIEL